MRSHNCEISAVKTDRLGSFLNDDLEPNVAASLPEKIQMALGEKEATHHRRPKPLSLRDNSSGVKNIGVDGQRSGAERWGYNDS